MKRIFTEWPEEKRIRAISNIQPLLRKALLSALIKDGMMDVPLVGGKDPFRNYHMIYGFRDDTLETVDMSAFCVDGESETLLLPADKDVRIKVCASKCSPGLMRRVSIWTPSFIDPQKWLEMINPNWKVRNGKVVNIEDSLLGPDEIYLSYHRLAARAINWFMDDTDFLFSLVRKYDLNKMFLSFSQRPPKSKEDNPFLCKNLQCLTLRPEMALEEAIEVFMTEGVQDDEVLYPSEFMARLCTICPPVVERAPGNEKTGTFDRIRININLTSSLFPTWEEMSLFLKEHRRDLDKMVVKSLKGSKRFRDLGIPVGFLKASSIHISRDYQMEYILELKEITASKQAPQ